MLRGQNLKGAIVPFYVDFNNGREINRLKRLGWYLCDGTGGTPDLTGRFILGGNRNNKNKPWKTEGGSESVTLSKEQMPRHIHHLSPMDKHNHWGNVKVLTDVAASFKSWAMVAPPDEVESGGTDRSVTATGGDFNDYSTQPHENMPPYYVLAYFIFL